jgi:hypothetical protein
MKAELEERGFTLKVSWAGLCFAVVSRRGERALRDQL